MAVLVKRQLCVIHLRDRFNSYLRDRARHSPGLEGLTGGSGGSGGGVVSNLLGGGKDGSGLLSSSLSLGDGEGGLLCVAKHRLWTTFADRLHPAARA